MSALLDLAERCEAATGPDRELDKAIFYALPFGSSGSIPGIPHYTASLDAAMTLVAEGSGFLLDRYWLREGAAWSAKISTGGVPENPAKQFWGEDAKTAALATCAAALRARAAEQSALNREGGKS